MKPIFLFLPLFVILCFACQTPDDESIIYESIPAGTLQATIDGRTFTSQSTTTVTLPENVVKVNFTDISSGLTFTLTNPSVDTFTIDASNLTAIDYRYVDPAAPTVEKFYTSFDNTDAEGKIIIMNIDQRKMSGTFEGRLVSESDPDVSIYIEDGLFNSISF